MFGAVDAHELDFGEFVESVEPSDFLAVGAGFAAETLRVCAVLYGEFFFVEYDVAVDVGRRALRQSV